jgi:predicted nucleotidyltransferase
VLDMEPRHLAEVRRILRESIPGLAVRAFGSRVRGGAKPHSDLDLVVMTAAPLPLPIKVRLEEAFAESRLPVKVEVLYWDELSEEFRRLIDQAWERIQDPAISRAAPAPDPR